MRGVAYAISDSQAQHLDRTEGVPKAYRRVAIDLVDDDASGRMAAFTYLSKRRTHGRKPSERYMGLLLRGARYHGLPKTYVDYLRAFELAVDERSSQLELFDTPNNTR